MSEANTTEPGGVVGPIGSPVPVSHAKPVPSPAAPNEFAALGFPVTKYHPVQGRKIFKDPNAVAQLDYNWFDTAAAADAARTEREAMQVVHHNLNHKVQGKKDAGLGIVRNSVSAQESVDAGNAEPM